MDMRELKGLELAARARITWKDGAWLVPSQSSPTTTYRVTFSPDKCECEDFAITAKPCKHIHAARIVRERDGGESAPPMDTDVVPKRPTYRQNWPLYDQAQRTEKRRFQALLHDLCRGLEDPPQKYLLNGVSTSCGCVHKEQLAKRNTIHGKTYSREYSRWCAMIARCENAKNKGYPRYGGRGIRVCGRWRESFENFLADMGPCPSPEHSLDRIDNDGDYEPGNVRWATLEQQSRNKSTNRMLTFNGETMCMEDWARRTGLRYLTIYQRLQSGWSVEDTLTRPLRVWPSTG